MEDAMDQKHFKMRWMLQAIDEGEIEGAMDGASNGRYNNLSLIYMSEYDTIKMIIIILHEFKNNNNNGIKKINCLYNGLVQSVHYLDLLVHYDLHYIGLVDCWSHYPEKE